MAYCVVQSVTAQQLKSIWDRNSPEKAVDVMTDLPWANGHYASGSLPQNGLNGPPQQPGENDVNQTIMQSVTLATDDAPVAEHSLSSNIPPANQSRDAAADNGLDSMNDDHDYMQFSEREKKKYVSLLEKAANCRRKDCRDQDCQFGKKILDHINTAMSDYNGDPPSLYYQNILGAIIEHTEICHEEFGPECRVPYCWYFTYWKHANIANFRRNCRAVEFSNRIPLPMTSGEETDLPVCHYEFNGFEWPSNTGNDDWLLDLEIKDFDNHNGKLCFDADAYCIPLERVKIIQRATQEHSKDLWRELSRLQDATRNCIVQHALVQIYEPRITIVCIVNENNVPLIDELESRPLSREDVVHYSNCILDATDYLHSHGIFYLNWTGCIYLTGQFLKFYFVTFIILTCNTDLVRSFLPSQHFQTIPFVYSFSPIIIPLAFVRGPEI